MRKTVWCLLALALLTGSCLKKESGCPYSERNVVAPANEQNELEAYLVANNIPAAKHSSGFYYEIVKGGTSDTAHLCSNIEVKYIGKLTNGAVFENKSDEVFKLGSLIEGWKKGLRLIGKGGEIRLYIPPALGYGYKDIKDGNGVVVIPGGSILIFSVTILDIY